MKLTFGKFNRCNLLSISALTQHVYGSFYGKRPLSSHYLLNGMKHNFQDILQATHAFLRRSRALAIKAHNGVVDILVSKRLFFPLSTRTLSLNVTFCSNFSMPMIFNDITQSKSLFLNAQRASLTMSNH